MQQLKTAVAVFCTACICAELVGRLLGDVRGRQCIKAAAGLYILVALFHALPDIRAGAADLVLPQVTASSYGTAEEAILRQAERDLSEDLARQLAGQEGLDVTVQVRLEPSDAAVRAAWVQVTGCPPQGRAAAQRLLCDALGIGAEEIQWSETPEGG